MKKSYDYFKTLKAMSDCICNAYNFVRNPDRYRKEILLFNANRTELSRSLSEEFVAPIERNDIYSLSNCLNEELYFVSKLNNIISLVDINTFTFVDCISEMFDKQNTIFSSLGDTKRNDKTIKLINESRATLNGVNSSIVLTIKGCLKNCNQPILKYAVASGFF